MPASPSLVNYEESLSEGEDNVLRRALNTAVSLKSNCPVEQHSTSLATLMPGKNERVTGSGFSLVYVSSQLEVRFKRETDATMSLLVYALC